MIKAFSKIQFSSKKPFPGKKEASFAATHKLTSHYKNIHLAYGISLVFAVLCLCLSYSVITSKTTEDKIFVIDGSRTIHIGPLENFYENKEFLGNISVLVNTAIFDRTPSGIGLPEVAKSLLSPKAYEKLQTEVRAQQEELKAKAIHQKGEVLSIKTVNHKNMPIINIKGQLVINGFFEGMPLVDIKRYQMRFLLTKNPNLTRSGMYPLIVDDFRIQWEEDAI